MMSRIHIRLCIAACLGIPIALGGCGGGTSSATSPSSPATPTYSTSVSAVIGHAKSTGLSVGKTAVKSQGFVACMHWHGMTVLSNGELRTTKVVTLARIDAAEATCGLRIAGPDRTKLEAEEASRRNAERLRALRSEVTKLAACMRANGVTVSLTQASSVLNSNRIKTRDPHTKAVAGKCRDEASSTSSP